MKKNILKTALIVLTISGFTFFYLRTDDSSLILKKIEKENNSAVTNEETSNFQIEEVNTPSNSKNNSTTLLKGKTKLAFNKEKDSIEKLKAKYAYLLRNHPFAKTKTLPKAERKAMGIPPNAYYEQEWLYNSNPVLGRPEPEVVLQLQMQLEEQERLGRVPGDGMDNQWEERGPNNVGGRTRALIFAPGSTTKVFAGGVSGGLWVNNNITSAASVWQQTNGVPSNLAVSCITVDPNNSNIMYIGTGEVYTWGAVNGNGVYKSIDGGQNWINIFGAATNANVRDNITYIQDIIAWNNPNTNQTEVFFGSDAMAYYDAVSGNPAWAWLGLNTIGLYRSTDGVNFTKLNNASLLDGSGRNYAPNTFDVGADGKLWMGTKRSYTYPIVGGMIFSSTNGTTWNLVRDFGTNGRVEVACSKTDANKIYVLLQNYATGRAEIKRTTDAFATSNINITTPVSSGNQPPAANDFCRGQDFYDLMIGVNPTNDSEIYVGGIEVFRSTNSGSAWTQLSDWTVNPGSTNGALDGMHSDQHCIAFAPGQETRVIFGNDGGIYYSNNSGGTLIDRNNGYNVTQFYKGGISQSGTVKLLAGAQDNGSQLINPAPAGVGSAGRVTGGDGCWVFIDKQSDFMVSSYVYNVYYFIRNDTNTATTYIANNQTDGDFVNQCGLDSDANILYANGTNGTTYRIYRYTINPTGNGSTTTATLTDALINDVPTYFEASPYTNNRVMVGLANGKLIRLDNANGNAGARTWTSIGDASWVGAISDIRYGASDNEIFVTFHNYGTTNIWYTSNGGTSWQNKEGDLPNLPVKCILQNPFATNEVIIGTELGVWYTVNFNSATPNWRRSNNGMKDTKVLSFDYRAYDNTILATTYGRGMFTGQFWQCGSTTTTWDGSTWSNSAPTKKVAAIINGNLSSTGDIEACSFTVNGTAQVTINSGHSLKVGEGVTVASGANLTIENNAALVQFSNTGVNSGNITVKRNSTAMLRQDYTAWSSPVLGQKLKAFSPGTLDSRFYTYNFVNSGTPATAYTSVASPSTTDFTNGKGYMIRVDNNWSSSVPTVYNGQFTGVPANGQVNIAIGQGYNLIGNPYPSPIDANRILLTNPKIDALYYWTHNVPQNGAYVAQTNYSSYTILGGTAAIAGGLTPNDYVQTGQGFFVNTTTAQDVIFENNLRRDAVSSTQFFRNSSSTTPVSEKHRIWLNLGDANVSYSQMLLGYMNGATESFDRGIDGKVFDTSKTVLYTIINDEAYTIQGRALPFNEEDIVPLGINITTAGSYTISLENVDGLFVSQDVYIKDKQTGFMHNIKQGDYLFTSQAGTFNDRFEIVYKKAVKNNDNLENLNNVNVYASNGILSINTSDNKIKTVEIYDVLGKIIYTKQNINQLEYDITNLTVKGQLLVVKIILNNGTQMTKKVLF
jgi:trimeric autotransporter adhesin